MFFPLVLMLGSTVIALIMAIDLTNWVLGFSFWFNPVIALVLLVVSPFFYCMGIMLCREDDNTVQRLEKNE